MAYQNAFGFEFAIQLPAVHLRVGGEDKIRHRGRGIESQLMQFPGGVFPIFPDLTAVFPHVFGVVQHTQARRHGEHIHVVGIGGVAQGVKIGNEALLPDGKAQSGACHAPGFGEGLNDQQIFVLVH